MGTYVQEDIAVWRPLQAFIADAPTDIGVT